jgi:hypothetical protein
MIRYAFVAAATLLAACAGSVPAPSAAPAAPLALRGGVAIAEHPDRRGSWMAPGAASSKALLYVSDAGTFDVLVYSYPSLKKVGTLTGFGRPQGECTDAAGDVWIANTIGQNVLEYAHGGTSAIADLLDPTGYPVGCAVDPASGDLAVTNIADLSGPGGVLVYRRARGTPKPYSSGAQPQCFFAAYDAKGNLFVSGSTKGGSYRLTELRKGSSTLSLLTVDGGTIHYPGTVAWDGSSLVLGDQQCLGSASSCLYQASFSGKTARITGSTQLGGACDVAQAWISSKQVVGGDYEYCGSRRSSVDLWPYPAGGNPVKRVTGIQTPVGATVSSQQSL